MSSQQTHYLSFTLFLVLVSFDCEFGCSHFRTEHTFDTPPQSTDTCIVLSLQCTEIITFISET